MTCDSPHVGTTVMNHAGWENGATSRALPGQAPDAALYPVTLPDGRPMLVVWESDTLRRWDLSGGEVDAPPVAVPDGATYMAPAPEREGHLLFVAAVPGDGLYVLDVVSGEVVRSVPARDGPVLPLVLPDGRFVAAAGGTFAIQFVDLDSGETVGPSSQQAGGPILAEAFDSVVLDGTLRLLTGRVGDVGVWDVAAIVGGAWTGTRATVPGLGDHTMFGPAIGLPLADGRTGVGVWGFRHDPQTGTTQSRISVLDARTLAPLTPPVTLPGRVGGLARLPLPDGGSLLIASLDDGSLQLFAPESLLPVGPTVPAHCQFGRAPVAVPLTEGRIGFATACEDGSVRVWAPVPPAPSSTTIATHAGPVNALAALPTGLISALISALFSAGADKTVHRVDPATGAPAGTPLTGHTGQIFALAVLDSPAPRLVSAGADATLRLWDPSTGAPVGAPLTGHTGPVRALTTAALADGTVLVVSAGTDATVRLWNAATGAPAGPALTGHVGPVYAVAAVSPALIASAGDDATVRLWDPATGQAVGAPLTGPTGPVRALTTVPVGGTTLLAGGGDDTTVRLWNPVTGQPVGAPLTGHTGPVRALTALPRPHGPTLLAGVGDDHSLRLWDPTTGHPVGGPLIAHTDTVRAVTTLTIGGDVRLATAGDDATIAVWTIP